MLRGVNLSKVFTCTYDTMVTDLLRAEQGEDLIDIIIRDIENTFKLMIISNVYIMDEESAIQLEKLYGIICLNCESE